MKPKVWYLLYYNNQDESDSYLDKADFALILMTRF